MLRNVVGFAGLFGVSRIVRCDAMADEVSKGVEKEKANAQAVKQQEGEAPELIKQADESVKKRKELRAPPQFQDQFGECKRLVNLDVHDGFRFEVQKPVTPSFVLTHSLYLGSTAFKGGSHYVMGAQVADDSDKMIMARLDKDCNLDGRIFFPVLPSVHAKLQLVLGEQQEMVMCNFDMVKDTFTGQLTLGKGPHFGLSYNQAVTPNLSVGGEFAYNEEQQVVSTQYGARYNKPDWMGSCLYQHGVMQLQYCRRVVPRRVTLGAELMTPVGAPEQSAVTLGAEFQLKQSRYNCCIDGSGKIDSTLEIQLAPGTSLTLTGELNHLENKHKFGFGFQMSLPP